VRFLVGQSSQMRKGRIRFDAAQSFIAPGNFGLEPIGRGKIQEQKNARRQVEHMSDAYVISLPRHIKGLNDSILG